MSTTAWDAVEHAILSAAREPATCQRIADRADLTPDVVKAQLSALEGEGLVTQETPGSGRYRLTLAGHKRMFVLADTKQRAA
jgi:DNA-binding IclR family transcriptional regulator